MGTEKRQRKKEGRQARLEAERAAATAAQRRRRLITAVVVSVAIFGVLVLLAGRAGEDDAPDEVDTTDTTAADGADDDDTTATTVDAADKPEVDVPEGEPPTELVIEDLEVGDGPVAQAGDTLEMHYVGVFFDDGEEFDASWNRGDSFTFELGAGQVIRGWDQGIEGMQVGGRRQLVIPPDLAYGPEGRGGIPPDSTLVFVVDLIGIS
jgi:peptidylprolyl isomerase